MLTRLRGAKPGDCAESWTARSCGVTGPPCRGAQAILQTSHETLEELHHVCAPKAADSLRLPPVRSLTRFGALRSLTLHENSPRCAEWPSRLPVSLQTLTMAVAQGG